MRITVALAAAGIAALSAQPILAQDPGASPAYGDVRLSAGFLPDPHVISLTAGGSTEVHVGNCNYGTVATAPDVDLYYSTSGGTNLYIYVESGDDTTLLINMPDGSWVCDDDGFTGTNPIVVIRNAPAGLYDIWVGTYSDQMASATLKITEIDPR